MWKGSAKGTQITTTSSYTGSQQYIKRHEFMAKAAYDKGDYRTGNIHNAAVESYLRGQHAAERTQAVANLTFSYLNAMAAAGEALIKNDFIKLRNWLEFNSGAIGERAPKGNHLSIFFLQFFDAESFQLDSRNRVAVFMVLTNKKGVSSLFFTKRYNICRPRMRVY